MITRTAVLREKMAQLVGGYRDELKKIGDEVGKKPIAQVTANQVIGGMRGILALLCDTSEVDPDRGLIVRGIPIADLTDRVPEEIFHLLLTGELPDKEELASLQDEFRSRAKVPDYVWKVLEAMPSDSHPMAMFNTAILCMERESIFRQRYRVGMAKSEYWEPMLEDSLTLLARLPEIAAGVYRIHTGHRERIPSDPKLDWSANYARMLGLPDPKGEFAELIRLYLVLHCDHESGNVSAFTAATVNSALSDIYYALSAGLNGLAGPLHGLANQECLRFVMDIEEHFGGVPSLPDLKSHCEQSLASGRVIPGYGHAVLRVTDPRFSAFLAFGRRACPHDDVFKVVEGLQEVVPKILLEQGKAKDPYPNVDAGSGALLYHFGMTEFDYYTVLFAVSRSLGICSQAILSRAAMLPIMRPKSINSAALRKLASKG
jgi:citrate synthase